MDVFAPDYCTNHVATGKAEDRAQRAAFGVALKAARAEWSIPEALERTDVAPFLNATVQRLPSVRSANGYQLVFDLTGEESVKSWTDVAARVIHLDPDRLDKWDVLHQLSHLLTPEDGHGENFAALLLELVKGAMGRIACAVLHGNYDDLGVRHEVFEQHARTEDG